MTIWSARFESAGAAAVRIVLGAVTVRSWEASVLVRVVVRNVGKGMTAELMAGLCQRDQASYQRLIAEYGPMMYRIALRLSGGPHDAQDVLQETLLIVMAKVDTVRDPATLGAWLRRVTANTALMRLRSRREVPAAEPEFAGVEFGPDGSRVQPVYAWPVLPEDELLRREARDVLEAAVDQLPDAARQVYVLAEIEELPREEVAELLGISREAVRVRLHRARTALRQVLEHYFAERQMLVTPRHDHTNAQPTTEDQQT
ncbi:MAG: RNA polymerase sigma factor [Mycolicibacterium sp.]|uniref:RNA polymerase sigma factor n=1 Tax=Mycolicibacterium sp. TaxID=2320850 RepID=UPI003D122BDE